MTNASRRRLLATLGAMGTVGTAGCSSMLDSDASESLSDSGSCSPYDPAVTTQGTWPTKHGGVDGTGAVAAEAVPDGPLTQDWSVPIDTHVGHHTPIVGDDTVYVHDMDTTLFAFEVDTGNERWRTRLEGPGPAPTLGGGRLVVATENGLEAYDAASGEHTWTIESPSVGIFNSAPIIADETVYIYGGVSVSAFALTDGSLQWRVPIGLASDSAPALDDDTLYVAGDDTYLRALSTADGSERWRQKTAAHITCNVAVVGETVYAGSDSGTVLACDRADGTTRWQYSLPNGDSQPQTIATDGARVYVTAGDTLYALDAATGRLCWRIDTHQGSYSSGIAIGDGTLFVPTDASDSTAETEAAGAVYDATNGNQLSKFASDVRYGFDGGPSLAGGAVYTHGPAALRRFSTEDTTTEE